MNKDLILLPNINERSAGHRLRILNILDLDQSEVKARSVEIKGSNISSKQKEVEGELNTWLQSLNVLRLNWKIVLILTKTKTLVLSKPKTKLLLPIACIAKHFRAKILVDFCDFEPQVYPCQAAYIDIADRITCPTILIAKQIEQYQPKQVHIVEDSIDPIVRGLRFHPHNNISSKMINVIWFGAAFKRDSRPTESLRIFREYAQRLVFSDPSKYSLRLVSEAPEEVSRYICERLYSDSISSLTSVSWDPNAMVHYLNSSDVAIIPYETPVEHCCKSANRIELALYSGLSVITNGRLPSIDLELQKYVQVLSHTEIVNHLLRPSEWKRGVDRMDLNEIRSYLDYKHQRISQKWLALINS